MRRWLVGVRKLVQHGAALVEGAEARRGTSEPRILPLAALGPAFKNAVLKPSFID